MLLNPGLRVVLDFVPNHSSHLHEWFQKAIDPSDPEHERYKAYYIWRGDDPTVLPNNWVKYSTTIDVSFIKKLKYILKKTCKGGVRHAFRYVHSSKTVKYINLH